MKKLLIIDPQNDFIDVHSEYSPALPVAGAYLDMQNTSNFIRSTSEDIGEIIITLDSHQSIAIERPGFWKDVNPFTQISHADFLDGKFKLANPMYFEYVANYLRELEKEGKFKLMIWPAHCVVGSYGFNIQSDVQSAVSEWELSNPMNVSRRVIKGMNPLTEQYSAIKAEVPVLSDESTLFNFKLVNSLVAGDSLYVAGEASSHCVKHTMLDIYAAIPKEALSSIYLLTDCMSPVSGFEESEAEFLKYSESLGVNLVTSTSM